MLDEHRHLRCLFEKFAHVGLRSQIGAAAPSIEIQWNARVDRRAKFWIEELLDGKTEQLFERLRFVIVRPVDNSSGT
jgi:hypothetical protein